MQKEELRVWEEDTRENTQSRCGGLSIRGGLGGSYWSPGVWLRELSGGGSTTEGAVGISQVRGEVKRRKVEGTALARAGGGRELNAFENPLVEVSHPGRVGV